MVPHQWSNDGMVTIHLLWSNFNKYEVKSLFCEIRLWLFISFIWLIANCTLHKPLIVEQLFSSDYPFASNCALIFFPGHKQKFAQWDGWFLLNIFSSVHIYHHLTSILLPFHKLTNKGWFYFFKCLLSFLHISIISNIFLSNQKRRLFKLPFQSISPLSPLSSAAEWKILNQVVWVKKSKILEREKTL